jgi:hypothetical protein
MRVMKTVSLISMIGAGALLGGCATTESVEHAQMSADQAGRDAGAARSAADRAQSTADGAAKSAQDATTSAQAANDKVDKLIADMQAKRRHTASHRTHRRHVASANLGSCPPADQKTQLKTKRHQAALYQLRPTPDKTARN